MLTAVLRERETRYHSDFHATLLAASRSSRVALPGLVSFRERDNYRYVLSANKETGDRVHLFSSD